MTTDEKNGRPPPGDGPGRRAPRKMTPGRLENIALHYLDRYSTSSENLRRVLRRRVWKSARHHDIDPDECAEWIEELIRRYLNSGLLDDAAYARAQAASHSRRGKSARLIRVLLQKKGLAASLIDEALRELAEGRADFDLAAAMAYASRRRLGPYRTKDIDLAGRQKELAAMARAGFSYAVAHRIVTADRVEDIDEE